MVERLDSYEGKYDVIRRGEVPPAAVSAPFWKKVDQTLQHVFQKSDAESRRLAGQLQEKLNEAGPDAQTAFYNADPLNVAADLAGVKEMSVEQVQTYLRQVRSLNDADMPDAAELGRRHPEE